MKRSSVRRRPLVLVVFDGVGIARKSDGNAITSARTPHWKRLATRTNVARLAAYGLDVGLPAGVMGNSEVGHLNIGAGRIVPQAFVRIDKAIDDRTFFENEILLAASQRAKRRGGRLHLMGLLSDGHVHASDKHVRALVDLAAEDLPPDRVYIHLFTDGRDSPPSSAARYVREIEAHALGRATVATLSGRYYAMDRDKRWERTALAYQAVVGGQGHSAADSLCAVMQAYSRGETDEFIRPTVLRGLAGREPLIRATDSVIFWNCRPDRARQLCAALANPDFVGFSRADLYSPDLHLASMTQYEETQPWPAAFPALTYNDCLGDVWSREGLRQLRIAETEKYAHVTYFFNGGREEPLPGEERILVPSPKVATYDLVPEMSARAITEKILEALREERFDAIVVNFANPDMVGHTGNLDATRRAVEVVDDCLGRLAIDVFNRHGVLVVTADHGKAEMMIDPKTGGPHTAHTVNPVPFLVAGAAPGSTLRRRGRLADVAPTVLELMALPKPSAMTGRSLLHQS